MYWERAANCAAELNHGGGGGGAVAPLAPPPDPE